MKYILYNNSIEQFDYLNSYSTKKGINLREEKIDT